MQLYLKQKLSKFLFEKMPSYDWRKICERSVLTFLAFALFWKGGKSLEATWLLTFLAWMCTYVYWWSLRHTERVEGWGKPKNDPVHSILWFGMMMFVGFTVLSFLKSSTGNYGLDEVLRTGSLALIFFWVMRKSKENGKQSFFERVVHLLLIALLVAGIIGLFVYFFQPVNRFVGTFFDYRFHTDYWPNAWADFILLSWPLVAWWVMRERYFVTSSALSFVEGLLRYCVLGLIIGFLLLSYSRGAMIAFGGQIILWIVFVSLKHWKRSPFPWKKMLLNGSVTFAVALILFFSSNTLRSSFFPIQSVGEKVTFTASEGTSSVSERAQFWNQAWVLSVQKPLTGWGPYSFRFVQPRLQKGVLATSDHPHNVILKFAAERGWIAALIFLTLVLTILIKAVRMELKSHQLFLVLGLTGFLAHSMIDYNLQFVAIALLFWLMLGMLAVDIEWKSTIKLHKKLVRFFEVTLATSLLVVAVLESQGMVLSSFGRHAEARGEVEKALYWYDKAKDQNMSRDMHLSRAKILYDLRRLDEAKNAISDYFEQNKEDPRAWKRLGDILRSQREVEEALEVYQIAYELGGKYNDASIMNAHTELLMDSNQWIKLEEIKNKYTAVMKEFVDAIEHNTHFVALSPNAEAIIELANHFSVIHNRKEAPLYQVLAARADHHSKLEREKIKARPPGYLW
ncbi:O-antigen ligase family protein [Patescibacteria group bacterium]|nr:O-antigen ligase family protein [Patescibacteria group bacterium]